MVLTNFRTQDPETSVHAGLRANVDRLEQIVLDCLRQFGPATTEEISIRTGVPLVSISPRMKPFEIDQRVHRTKLRRRNRSGRNAVVWALDSPAGRLQSLQSNPQDLIGRYHQNKQVSVRRKIQSLCDEGKDWEGLRLAHENNIKCDMELEPKIV